MDHLSQSENVCVGHSDRTFYKLTPSCSCQCVPDTYHTHITSTKRHDFVIVLDHVDVSYASRDMVTHTHDLRAKWRAIGRISRSSGHYLIKTPLTVETLNH